MRFFNFLIIIIAIFSMQLNGQVFENFTDSISQRWQGTRQQFEIREAGLFLAGRDRTDSAYLFTVSKAQQNASWKFDISLLFNPSSQNNVGFFIVPKSSDLEGLKNGYKLSFGEHKDKVMLERYDNGEKQLILESKPQLLNQSRNTLQVELSLTSRAHWSLKIVSEDSTYSYKNTDSVNVDFNYVGWKIQYTKTRKNHVVLDNVRVYGSGFPDWGDPQVKHISAASKDTISMWCNEMLSDLHQAFVEEEEMEQQQYKIKANQVLLAIDSKKYKSKLLKIDLIGLEDDHGNSTDTTLYFYHKVVKIPEWKDLVFSELMVAPKDTVGWSSSEYLELYNRTDDFLSLEGLRLSDFQTSVVLGKMEVPPKSYTVVVKKTEVDNFPLNVRTLALEKMPILNNDTDRLRLTKENGEVIEQVEYTAEWYGSEMKQNNGYALEKMDLDNICARKRNWSSSNAIQKGTPGQKNSISATLPDHFEPNFRQFFTDENGRYYFLFDEVLKKTLDPIEINNRSLGQVRFAQDTLIVAVKEQGKGGDFLQVTFANIMDCQSNEISGQNKNRILQIPKLPNRGDVLINELLFDPYLGGEEYVELYNTTQITLDLKGVEIKVGNKLKTIEKHAILLPGSYLVLSKSKSAIEQYYGPLSEENYFQFRLPALPNEGAGVSMKMGATVLDSIYYEDEMHSPYLLDAKGVSLESNQRTEKNRVWSSCSERQKDRGTPGQRNSQVFGLPENKEIWLQESVFSPTRQDLSIFYKFNEPAVYARVYIVNLNGKLIKRIWDGGVIGTQGKFIWNGTTNGNKIAMSGMYFVAIEFIKKRESLFRLWLPVILN